MKKYLIMICAGLLAFTSCMNDFDGEDVKTDIYTANNIDKANTTISEIRKAYSSAISGSTYEEIKTDIIIEGVVVANDISGNIYQFVYLQSFDENDNLNTEEGGIAVGIKGIGALYTVFPVGQKVRINLKGLYVGGYGKSPRIGMPYINTNGAMRLGPMPVEMMKTRIQKIGTISEESINNQARVVTADDIQKKLSTLAPMLVKLENAKISDAGWPYAHWEIGGDVYSEYHDISINGKTVKELLYTSTSATFAGDTIKDGTKTIYGLLNLYSSSAQLSLRSLDDVIEVK